VSQPNVPAGTDRALPTTLAGVAVVVFCAIGVLSAIIEVLLIPLYLGSHVFPLCVVIAVVVNVALPMLVRRTVDWRWAVWLPIVGWVVAAFALGFTNTGSGSVLVPGYGNDEYVGLALYFIGTLAGFISVMRELGSVRAASAASSARR
jgi:hypothetical protein